MIGEKTIGAIEFTVKTTHIGDIYINGKFYRQLAFTPNQIALVIEDYLNGVPGDDEEENHGQSGKET